MLYAQFCGRKALAPPFGKLRGAGPAGFVAARESDWLREALFSFKVNRENSTNKPNGGRAREKTASWLERGISAKQERRDY